MVPGRALVCVPGSRADPRCGGLLEFRERTEVIVTSSTYGTTSTQVPTFDVLDEVGRDLDTLALAGFIGDTRAPADLEHKQRAARVTGGVTIGIAIPLVVLGGLALDNSVNGQGGDAALIGGATALSVGVTGLIFGPIWLGVRPAALRANPAAFYPLDQARDAVEAYNVGCGYVPADVEPDEDLDALDAFE